MEVTLDQAINMLKVEEAKYSDLNNKIAEANAVLSELITAKVTLENLPKKKTETLVPIGGGVFLPVSATKEAKLIVSVGAGASVEKSVTDTISFLDSKINAVKESLDELIKLMNKTQKNINVLREKINASIKNSNQAPTVVG